MLDPWLIDLRNKLEELYGRRRQDGVIQDDELGKFWHLAKTYRARLVPCASDDQVFDVSGLNLEKENETRILARVTENKRLTREDWFQDVRHIEFDIQHEEKGGTRAIT